MFRKDSLNKAGRYLRKANGFIRNSVESTAEIEQLEGIRDALHELLGRYERIGDNYIAILKQLRCVFSKHITTLTSSTRIEGELSGIHEQIECISTKGITLDMQNDRIGDKLGVLCEHLEQVEIPEQINRIEAANGSIVNLYVRIGVEKQMHSSTAQLISDHLDVIAILQSRNEGI